MSVGFSGQSNTGGAKRYAADLQKELDKKYGTGKYTVSAGIDSDLAKAMENSGKKASKNPIGNCAEPKAASAASQNTSPITGMDTRWRAGGEGNPHKYTGNGKTSDSQMNPCKTCQTFEYEYMEHANKGKKE